MVQRPITRCKAVQVCFDDNSYATKTISTTLSPCSRKTPLKGRCPVVHPPRWLLKQSEDSSGNRIAITLATGTDALDEGGLTLTRFPAKSIATFLYLAMKTAGTMFERMMTKVPLLVPLRFR